MRIIKEGQAKKAVYRGICWSCKAEVEFDEGEVQYDGSSGDQRDSGYVAKCPTPRCDTVMGVKRVEVPA